MKTKKQTISILVLLFCLLSCNFDKHRLNRETFLYRYNSPEDSLKREAVAFLLENMTDQVSEIPDSGFIPVPKNIPDSLVVNNRWFKYTDRPASNVSHPGLNELLRTGSGNCYDWSYLNVMIMRSYGVALPKGNTYEIISSIFLVDSTGSKTFFKPNYQTTTLHLTTLNTGSRSWVEKGKNYSLYYFGKNGNWILFNTKQCISDSLITFEKVPSGTLYQLWDMQEKKRLERIFTYENATQVFW